MALLDVEIGVPTGISHGSPLLPALILPISRFTRLIVIWNLKRHIATTIAQPDFVIPQ